MEKTGEGKPLKCPKCGAFTGSTDYCPNCGTKAQKIGVTSSKKGGSLATRTVARG